MPSLVYDSFRRSLLAGGIDLATDPVKVMLVGDSYQPDRRHATTADVYGEVGVGGGYVAGGAELTGKTVAADGTFDAADVVWPSSTISARGCVLYGGETGELICYFDFDVNRMSMAGVFRLTWDPAGIITLDDGE